MNAKSLLALAIGCSAFGIPIVAAAAASTPVPSDQPNTSVGEIIVTATRREERLQNVPIPVTALTPKKLADQGVLNVTDLVRVTPGLVYPTSGVNAMPTIRGVGTRSFSPGDSSPIALYVDGVYMPAMGDGIFEFGDVERIEVLKGPQGTLFGRNATGGAINVITRMPSDHPELDADIGYGSYGRVLGSVYATDEVAKDLKANIFANFDQDQGFLKNLATGKDVPDMRDWSIRGKLEFTPTPMLDFILEGDYSSDNMPATYMSELYSGTNRDQVGHPGSVTTGAFGESYSFVNPVALDIQAGVSLTSKLNFDNWGLTSITAERETISKGLLDTSDISIPLSNEYLRTTNNTFTQELLASSSGDKRLNWVAGLFFMDDDAKRNPQYSTTSVGSNITTVFADERTQALAPYGEVNFKVTPKFVLIFGARYSYEYKHLDNSSSTGTCLVIFCTTPKIDTSKEWSSFNYRVTAQYIVSPELNFYATNSTGFKSGAYNSTAFSAVPAGPEDLVAYELGMKAQRRWLSVNMDGFYYIDKGIQVSGSVNPTTGLSLPLQNAAEAREYGVEFTTSAAMSDSWSADVGLTWLHARYTAYPGAAVYLPNPVASGGGNVLATINATGLPTYRSPDWSGNVDLNYRHPLFNGRFAAQVGVYATSSYAFEPSDHVVNPAYATLHLQASWTTPDGRYTITVWGDNVTNAHYYSSGNASVVDYSAVWAMPATYGVKVSMHLD